MKATSKVRARFEFIVRSAAMPRSTCAIEAARAMLGHSWVRAATVSQSAAVCARPAVQGGTRLSQVASCTTAV